MCLGGKDRFDIGLRDDLVVRVSRLSLGLGFGDVGAFYALGLVFLSGAQT